MKTHIELGSPNGSQPGPANRRAHSRLRAFFRAGDEGSALVEIALIMGPLLAIITAICTFAIAFNNQLTLTQAVGSGAQYLQLIRTSTTDPCADTLTAIEAAAPTLKAASINITVTMNGVTPTQTGNSCSGGQTNLVAGQPITVYATYPCVLSIMPLGYGTQFLSNCQLQAKVTEYEY